jgi:hypothetical protein
MTAPRVSPDVLRAIREAWRTYEQAVNDTRLMENAKKTYLLRISCAGSKATLSQVPSWMSDAAS